MLQLLRVNNPAIVFFSVLVSLLLHVLAMFQPFDVTFVLKHSEPLSAPIFNWLHTISGSAFFYLLCLLGCVVQIVQAILINTILNEFKIISKYNYLGGLVFILCSSLDRQWLILSPQQISTLLLIPVLYFVFTLSRQEKFYTQLFDLGFFAMLSVLFYFPSVFFLVFIFPALYSVRSFHLKEFFRVVIGLLSPVFVVYGVAYINDTLPYLWQWIINAENMQFFSLSYFSTTNIVLLILNGFWLIVGIVMTIAVPFSLSMQTRKMIGAISISTILTVLFFFLPTWFSDAYWLLLSVSSSIFLAIVLSEMKNELIANIIFALLFLSAIVPIVLL